MSKVNFVAVTTSGDLMYGTPSVKVVKIVKEEDALVGSHLHILEVHYCGDRRQPKPGDCLGTWRDGSTLYAMAPRR